MKDFFNDLLGQLFTGIGLFIAWIVLEGTAKTVVGYAIIVGFAVWVASFWIRNKE